MSVDITTEKRFESDIEASLLSLYGGYTHNDDIYDPSLGCGKSNQSGATLGLFVSKEIICHLELFEMI